MGTFRCFRQTQSDSSKVLSCHLHASRTITTVDMTAMIIPAGAASSGVVVRR